MDGNYHFLTDCTPNEQAAFAHIATDAVFADRSTTQKRQIVSALRKYKILRPEVLRMYPLACLASGADFQFALCIGARMIWLVDPCYAQPSRIGQLVAAVGQVGKFLWQAHDTVSFEFEFSGRGVEQCELRLLPQQMKTRSGNNRAGAESVLRLPRKLSGVVVWQADEVDWLGTGVHRSIVSGGALISDCLSGLPRGHANSKFGLIVQRAWCWRNGFSYESKLCSPAPLDILVARMR